MIVKLKHIANLCGNAVKEFDGTKRYYSTGNINTENYELVTYKNRPSRANVVVKENDILIAKMKNTNKTTIANKEMENNIFSTGFSVLESKGINNKYLYYLLESPEFIEKKDVFSVGTTQVSINDETLKNIEINYVEDVEYQNKIVNYLDKKILSIDNVVKKTKETIEDYKKLKVSIITKTTSKGLNSKCKMKETGIDLIGQIPKHWGLKKVKYIVDKIGKGNGITKEEVVENGDTPCIRYGEIYTKYNYFFDNCITRTDKDLIGSKKYISYGDLLFAGTGELIEEIGKNITYLGNDECLTGGDIVIVKHHQDPLFMTFALNSDFGQGQKSFGKAKLKVVHISGAEIGNLVIPVPPIDEQKEIGLFLKEKCNEIDKLIESKEKIIEELEQYKKSVIYEYVTGKKEVK